MELSFIQNHRYLRIDSASEGELDQLTHNLTKKIKGWRFHPLVKNGVWDGKVSFINKGKFIPGGLWGEINDICKKYKFNLKINGLNTLYDNEVNFEEFSSWIYDYFSEFDYEMRDYQIHAAYNLIKHRRCIGELATSAGKTFVTYMAIAYMLHHNKSSKILFVVPRVDLVIQGFEDFTEYNYQNKTPLKIQQLYAGKKVKPECNIVMGTYQSLDKYDKEFFEEFDCVIVDECHGTKGKTVRSVLERCVNCNYSIGITGTIPKDELERFTVLSHLGPKVSDVNVDYLTKNGYVTKSKVKQVYLDYAKPEVKRAMYKIYNSSNRKELYQMEMKFIRENKARLDFITNIIERVPGNSLVLFNITDYGKELYNTLKGKTDRPVYYIDGTVKSDVREHIKSLLEAGEDCILVASSGTFSTGISVKKIHNIYFAESWKADTIVRQSIGRGLRKHESKDVVYIIDFVDDFSIKVNNKPWYNYIYRHAKERIKIYKEQKYEYTIKHLKFDDY